MKNIEILIDNLNEKYNLGIENKSRYIPAFTHASYINENKKIGNLEHYERLEFLGDATLELATSRFLFDNFPNKTEGELTKIRATLVCEQSLVHISKLIEFDSYILLGRGEELLGGRNRPALLADVFESFIGALYLDRGLEVVYKFLTVTLFRDFLEKKENIFIDYKTTLQEYANKIKKSNVVYKLINSTGPSHEKIFESNVFLDDENYGKGLGKTKKESEQQAAKEALEKLNYFKEF